MRKAFALLLAFGAVSASLPADARSTRIWDEGLSVSPVYARPLKLAKAPAGYLEFCENTPAECKQDVGGANIVHLDERTYGLITAINQQINHTIIEVSDMDHYHVADFWTLPTDGKGDCEDFQLQKRHDLIAMGFPSQALMITVVRDENDEGHAVLIVRTDRGDLVLDNRTDMIRDWASAPYEFVKRQSQEDPMVWVYIGDPALSVDRVASGQR